MLAFLRGATFVQEMIRIRESKDRGHVDYGWLNARYTFSFGHYSDPEYMGYGFLRVLNQDVVQPGRGFDTHGHRDMEIVTVVLQGGLVHRDSMGNGSTILPGEVQLMSAGSGVTHSEYNASETETCEVLQMWVLPAERNTLPRYAQLNLSSADPWTLAVSPNGRDGSLPIRQDALLYKADLRAGEVIRHKFSVDRCAWMHVARGELELNGRIVKSGDGAALEGLSTLEIQAVKNSQAVMWEMPKQ